MSKKTARPALASDHVQEHFVQKLRRMLPPGIGIAEEIADILGISPDSAYRRIRGETEFTIGEIYKISKRHAISIDDVFSNQGDTVTFAYTKLTNSAENFEQYLLRINHHLKAVNRMPVKKLYYVAEEIPIFYSFYSPLFADFKLFYWQRSVLNIPELQHGLYEPGRVSKRVVEVALDCYKEYSTVPSVEVWTDLTVLTGLRQVGFYFDSGVVSKDLALELLDEYRRTINMIAALAETGRKNPSDQSETFQLYDSEVVLGTNCIYVSVDGAKFSYISFNTMNSITTSNPEFCSETEHWMRNLEKKSTLISGVSEKQRYQFFSSMYKKIDDAKRRILEA